MNWSITHLDTRYESNNCNNFQMKARFNKEHNYVKELLKYKLILVFLFCCKFILLPHSNNKFLSSSFHFF